MKFRKDIDIALTYNDVQLEPLYSDITSRKEIDLSSALTRNFHLGIPIISSPMDTVSGKNMSLAMNRNAGMAVIHRYNSIRAQVEEARAGNAVAAAIGATGDFFERAFALVVNADVRVLCIDVAHGHHEHVREALKKLRRKFGDSVILMAGNVATADAALQLESWGADLIRVGIGNGSICSTRLNTGHGIPSITSIADASKYLTTAKVVADGGIKSAGDMVKALAAGADFVMIGSMLAGTDEAPGEVIELPQGTVKEYRGMASREAQHNWRGTSSAPEGITTFIPYKGPVDAILDDIKGHLRSGLSYSGARSIKELQNKAIFIRQTASGAEEAMTHILHRYA